MHALLVDWPAIKRAAEVGHLYLARFGPARMAAVAGWVLLTVAGDSLHHATGRGAPAARTHDGDPQARRAPQVVGRSGAGAGDFRLRAGGEIPDGDPARTITVTLVDLGHQNLQRSAWQDTTLTYLLVDTQVSLICSCHDHRTPYPAGAPGPGRGRPAQRRRRAGRRARRPVTDAGPGRGTSRLQPRHRHAPLRLQAGTARAPRPGHADRIRAGTRRPAARPGPPPAADRRLRQRPRRAGRPEPGLPAVVGRGGHVVRTGSDPPRAIPPLTS